MSVVLSEGMTYPEAARIVRDAMKNKAYRAFPMGGEFGAYLRWKRGRLTPASYRDCECSGDKLARFFPDLEIRDFEPPVGTERLEEFLDALWGDAAPRTYNKNLSYIKEFFKFEVLKGKLHGDPALPLVRHKERAVHRETFNADQKTAILEYGPDPGDPYRDRCALRLLLHYGLRKGALLGVQLKSFDHTRRKVTFTTKGGKWQTVPIPELAFWNDLERFIQDTGGEPEHYLLCRQKWIPRGYDPDTGESRGVSWKYRDKPMGAHGSHDWWYGCLERAGVVAKGVTSGEKMHKSRHTAGQSVLDKTGNIVATQKLLGHSDPATTQRHYVDWDYDQLEATMREVTGDS